MPEQLVVSSRIGFRRPQATISLIGWFHGENISTTTGSPQSTVGKLISGGEIFVKRLLNLTPIFMTYEWRSILDDRTN